MPITALQAKVTKTAAFDGAGVDISGITGDATLVVRVHSMTAAKRALIEVQDSVDAFTAKRTVAAFHIPGGVSSNAPIRFSKRKYEIAAARLGTGSATMRVSVTGIDSGGSLEYEAWLET